MRGEAGRAEAREASSTRTAEDRQVSEHEDTFRGLVAKLLRHELRVRCPHCQAGSQDCFPQPCLLVPLHTLEYADACLKISRAESASSSPRSCGRLAREKEKPAVCYHHFNGHTARPCLPLVSPCKHTTMSCLPRVSSYTHTAGPCLPPVFPCTHTQPGPICHQRPHTQPGPFWNQCPHVHTYIWVLSITSIHVNIHNAKRQSWGNTAGSSLRNTPSSFVVCHLGTTAPDTRFPRPQGCRARGHHS